MPICETGSPEEVRSRLNELKEELRKVAPDGRLTLIGRLLYRDMLREIARLEEIESQQTRPVPIGKGPPSADTPRGFLPSAHLPDFVPVEQQIIVEAIIGQLVFVNDLVLILNQGSDDSLRTLEALRRLYPTLHTFAQRFLLINEPSIEQRWVLKEVVSDTTPDYMRQCEDARIARHLLGLYELTDSIRFSDGTEVVDAFIFHGHKKARSILQEYLAKPEIGGLAFGALIKFGKQLPVNDLLLFAGIIDSPVAKQYEWVAEILLVDRGDELGPFIGSLQEFLTKARASAGRPILGTSYLLAREDVFQTCLALIDLDPLFAQWLTYNELVYISPQADDLLLSYLERIKNVLKSMDTPVAASLFEKTLLALLEYDWEENELASFVKKLPAEGDLLSERLHAIVSRRLQASLFREDEPE